MPASRILIVRLPCRKVFPTGPLYLSALLRRAAPAAPQRILDLALVQRGRYQAAVEEAVRDFLPDLVAFSWRDMQIFSPQDMDGGLRDAFIFFHDPSLLRKLVAAFRGLRDMFVYRSAMEQNLRLIEKTAARHPSFELALGGPSIRIFGDRLRSRLSPRVRVFSETDLGGFFRLAGLTVPSDPVEPRLDLEFIEHAFPQHGSYHNEVIGIQTKQGCSQSCLYCLYGLLEGKAIRRRAPANVVQELEAYHQRWGARRFWFADAQLLSEPRDRDHLAAILSGVISAKLDITWSGYLRVHSIDDQLASLMVRSGIDDLEISLNSGSQRVIDELRLDFTVEQVLEGCRKLSRAGYRGKVLVNLSLNAPGETRESLLDTMKVIERIRQIFGADRVVPVIFFLAIQPRTGLERRALDDHHLRKGYDPLSVWPWDVLRLIYNPPPLGRIIGRICAREFIRPGNDLGSRILASLEKELLRKPCAPSLEAKS
jgi:radical SAM superfamily enzyme YgiQ (UPF0313 family)